MKEREQTSTKEGTKEKEHENKQGAKKERTGLTTKEEQEWVKKRIWKKRWRRNKQILNKGHKKDCRCVMDKQKRNEQRTSKRRKTEFVDDGHRKDEWRNKQGTKNKQVLNKERKNSDPTSGEG